ncbi:MAG TPA: acylphosphatase [Burkholderiaceae bacterium]|jgi:acylphosphatase|nr:acylphosphatase [Burkholderiaceae bacterium]
MATHLVINGMVQGVGYRASFAQAAIALGLAGWVRNRRNGSVEACIDGDATAVDALLVWARRGPPAARVTDVAVTESEVVIPSDGNFQILPTA